MYFLNNKYTRKKASKLRIHLIDPLKYIDNNSLIKKYKKDLRITELLMISYQF